MSEREAARKPWSILRAVLGPVLTPVYGAAVARRNARFDRGEGVKRAAVPVVSVGNLTVGGTGKTPIVQWLARELLAAGRRPAIAMRGYRSRDGVSDEAELYRASLAGVPVLVNPDRFTAIGDALAAGPGAFDCVILDDGFQHRRLARDIDIVLIDAQTRTLTDRLLPAGDLREPVAGLARAGVVIFTHATGEAPPLPVTLHAPAIVTTAEHVWVDVERRTGLGKRDDAAQPVKRALAVCGIGQPERFFAQVRAAVGELRTMALPDHDPFAEATCKRIVSAAAAFRADAVFMTEKDWVKARRFAWPPTISVIVPSVRMRVHEGEKVMRAVLASIRDAERSCGQAGR